MPAAFSIIVIVPHLASDPVPVPVPIVPADSSQVTVTRSPTLTLPRLGAAPDDTL